MEILDRLARHARQTPQRAAVVSPGSGRLDYAQLSRAVSGIAAMLRARAGPDEVVILSCVNCPEFVASFLGVLAAGATVFPVSPGLSGTELERAAQEAGATGTIARGAARSKLASCGLWTVTPEEVTSTGAEAPPRDDAPSARGRLLLQSSGTTGLPKIVSRGAASLDAVARNVAGAVALSAEDTVLAAVPMSHSYGVENVLLAPIWAGATICALPAVEPALLETLLRRDQVSVFPGVPFMFEVLGTMAVARRADNDEAQPAAGRARLRSVYSAGGTLPTAVESRFADAWGIRVGQLYGASELGSVTFNSPDSPGFDPSSVGLPLDGVEILVVDPENPEPARRLPPGVEGHILVRAPSMLDGYIGEPAPVVDGYFRTSDLGRLDALGRLWITGRLKLLIDVGGIKVNPLEVEAVLAQHPDVRDCVVVPIRVSETVSRLRAVVTARSGTVNIEALKSHARERLAPYKVPRLFEVRDSLPKSPTGKILRREIEREVGA